MTITGRPKYAMLKYLMDSHLTTSTSYWARIGEIGDIDMAIEYGRRPKVVEALVSIREGVDQMMRQAILENQTHLITHMNTNHPTLISPISYRQYTVECGNVEQVEMIFGLAPVSINFRNYVKKTSVSSVFENGHEDDTMYLILKKVLLNDNVNRISLLECILKHFGQEVLERIKSTILPLFTMDLVRRQDHLMLQYLLDIGAALQLKGVKTCTQFKSDTIIQSIFTQYKEQQAMNKKRGRGGSSGDSQVDNTTIQQQPPTKINKNDNIK
ncbi:hypothetical protein SAMD00019534_003130 [Acytostelium subglobosum LB1]|uniref:hypothetical protein n=1 Tax=Acytostelium subglobosum LB1 TaxID=1410327 RepID=UPI0006450070|nr:hypothetical protein SAMD00019534_003130 [Acytostelium subglobosum LB1]GAM17138.1 hypothetical protein SAMD00019534_003130 [Acytostelium subglobosum LB1]|eukprot:XP_012759200.1 hypothetical protein SAMD00019534_003130 [Acytostelium subglobosum LB1]